MRRLAELYLRKKIRRLLREYSLDERAYSDKGLGIHLSQLDSLIRGAIKKHGIKYPDSYDKTKMNPWKPTPTTERGLNWPGFSRSEMQKMINGIIDLFWLEESDTGQSARSVQNKFKFADNIEDLGQTCRDQVENVIFEWLTGNEVPKSKSKSQAQPPKWDSNPEKYNLANIFGSGAPEYKLDILGYDKDIFNLHRFGSFLKNGNRIKLSYKDWNAKSSSPKKSVEILQRRLEKVLEDNQKYISAYKLRSKDDESNELYNLDQAFNDASGQPLSLDSIKKDGTYLGREFFTSDEQFQELGEYLNDEFISKYEYLLQKYKESEEQEERDSAHSLALQGAKEYVNTYGEAFGLSKDKPDWWDK